MSLERVIAVAEGEVGNTELPPGSNRVKYWDIFGSEWQGQPWCVAFLWWCCLKAGESTAFMGGGKTASCGILLRWYRAMDQTVDIEDIQVGDIALYNFHGGKDPEHCGLVYEVNRWSGTRKLILVQSIEGNTSVNGSQDNGGMVAQKTRYPSQIVAVCRPKYQPEEPAPVDDWSNHHAADAIRWGIEMGLIQGYPDGSMRPDEPMPMWRALTILKRYHERMEESI